MSTLKTYLTAVDADADSAAAVYWDKVESFLDSEPATDVETTDISYSSATAQDATTILLLTASSGDGTPAGSAIAAKRVFIIDLSDAAATIGLESGVNDLFATGTDATTGVSETIESNSSFMLASLQNAANVARFAAYGIDITSSFVANSTGVVSLITHQFASASSTISGERYVSGDDDITLNAGGGKTAVTTATNFGVGLDDLFTFSVGGNSVTVSPGGAYGGSQTVTTLTAIGNAIISAYGLKYGKGGTASGSAVATLTNAAGIIDVVALDKGTAGNGLAIGLSVAAGTVTATNAKNINWLIGGGLNQAAASVTAASTDNKTAAEDVLLTATVASGAADITSTLSFTTSTIASMPEELTTTRLTNSAQVSDEYALAQVSADAIQVEGATAGTAASTPAISFSRVAWL